MRALLLAALVLLTVLAAAPAADARPPQPGGGCQVQEEYVTEASIGHGSGDPTSLPSVQPGAARPIECYY